MTKIAVNRDWGEFGVSKEVCDMLGIKWDKYGYLINKDFGIDDTNTYAYRTNPKLIEAIERLGSKKASGQMACIDIVEIPDDVEWLMYNYDGMETIHEKHRSW